MTSLYNIFTAPPGVNASLQGYQQFDVFGSDSDDPAGHFYAYVSTVPYLASRADIANEELTTSQVLYVSPDVPGYEDPTGIAPAVGSVISTTGSFGGLFTNVYSATPSGETTTITDILKTPFGNIDVSNSSMSSGSTQLTCRPCYRTGSPRPATQSSPPLGSSAVHH